jgi:hypothetical protein
MADKKGEKTMTELNLDQLEQVTGGQLRTVNTGVAGLNATLRIEPRKSAKQIGSIPNGTRVDTVSNQLVFDPESGRNFVEVCVNGKRGWVASSLVGLPR